MIIKFSQILKESNNIEIERAFMAPGSWIDPNGRVYKLSRLYETHREALFSGQLNDFAYNISSAKETIPEEIDSETQAERESRFLHDGWIMQRDNTFTIFEPLDRNKKDIIFMFAKENGFDKIYVSSDMRSILENDPLEMLYEQNQLIENDLLIEAKVKPISPKELWSYIVRNVRELDNKENNEDEAGEKGFSNLDLLLDKNWNSFVFYCKKADIENINSKLKKIGWFISKKQGHLQNFDEDKSYEYEIVIQPFYTEKITPENPKSGILNLPQDIYHFTSINNVDNIKKNGIIPKGSSKEFSYPDRVYFFTNWPSDEIIDMAQEMEHNIKSIDDVAIVEVDTTKIRKKVNFYRDANVLIGSIWTYHHIPPQAIKSIRVRNGDAWREI